MLKKLDLFFCLLIVCLVALPGCENRPISNDIIDSRVIGTPEPEVQTTKTYEMVKLKNGTFVYKDNVAPKSSSKGSNSSDSYGKPISFGPNDIKFGSR